MIKSLIPIYLIMHLLKQLHIEETKLIEPFHTLDAAHEFYNDVE